MRDSSPAHMVLERAAEIAISDSALHCQLLGKTP